MDNLKKKRNKLNDYALYLLVFLMFLSMLLIFFHNSYLVNIESGESGVLYRRLTYGTDTTYTFDEGVKIIAPWNKMFKYDMRVQEINDTINALTKDGLTVDVQFSSHFRPIRSSLGKLHKHIGPEYIMKIIVPEVSSTIRDVIGQYNADELFHTRRVTIADSIMYTMKRQVSQNFIMYENMMLRSIVLPDKITEAIELKMKEEQTLLMYDYRLQVEEKEALRKLIQARGIKAFNDTSAISILQWKGLEVTGELAKSPNSKVIVLGTGSDDLPIILGGQ